jgi:hypothetical protein
LKYVKLRAPLSNLDILPKLYLVYTPGFTVEILAPATLEGHMLHHGRLGLRSKSYGRNPTVEILGN